MVCAIALARKPFGFIARDTPAILLPSSRPNISLSNKVRWIYTMKNHLLVPPAQSRPCPLRVLVKYLEQHFCEILVVEQAIVPCPLRLGT